MAKSQRRPPRKKIPAELAELITISRAVGSDPDLVQGGGGNTSVKTRDGQTILVKASGAALGEMSQERGWAALDLEAVRAILEVKRLARLPVREREAQVLSLLQSTVRHPARARPSVESSVHALLDRVVIHTHPVHLSTFLCARDSRQACEKLLPRIDPPPSTSRTWIPVSCWLRVWRARSSVTSISTAGCLEW